ncbi:MAG: 2-phospho-L-lactate guanylyltransferase [Betaproteobacteria bacterium]|nr:2-phospho-L-lactate guanylyltransferase [Betaproteobacteria bacterium]
MRPLWIIIPGQAFNKGKTRLTPVLDATERHRFSRECLIHVVRTARRVILAHRIVVVSRGAEVLGLARRLGVRALLESGRGLNNAVADASAFAAMRGAAATLVLHADLPRIEIHDVIALRAKLVRHEGVVLAPDQLLDGSNALGLRPPGAIRYRFGQGSFNRHRSLARGARLRIRIVSSPGLALDIDTPENYQMYSNSYKVSVD